MSNLRRKYDNQNWVIHGKLNLRKEKEKILMKKSLYMGVCAMTLTAVMATSTIVAIKAEADIKTMAVQENKQATTVNSFDELKVALKDNNGITDVILGSDITLTSGIEINSAKRAIIIDGNGHTIKESVKGSTGTIYISKNNGTKEVTLKNALIDGKNFYGPVNVNDGAYGVTLNYENITYKGPQLVHNVHGFANFSGNNNIDIVTNGTDSDKGQELFEGLGVNISGEFVLTHEGTTDSAFWFGLGATSKPFLNIKEKAKVSMDIVNNTLFYVDFSDLYPLDVTVEKGAEFNVKTKRELFRLGHAGNVQFLENSKTHIERISNSNTHATMELKDSHLSVLPKAELSIIHAEETKASIIESTKSSVIDFNNVSNVDLKGSSEAKVFDSVDTILGLNTNHLKSWYGTAGETPDYQNDKELSAKIKLTSSNPELIESNQQDILDNWNIKQMNHLVLSNNNETIEQPILNVITDKDTRVTGTGIPGNTIQIETNGEKLGETIVNESGKWSLDLSKELTAGTIVTATQTDGNLISLPVQQEVQHMNAETVNYFSVGYWQDYGMILEGQMDNNDWELNSSDSVERYMNLVSEEGAVALKKDAVNTNWFGNPKRYNGYQTILEYKDLTALPNGKYKVQIGTKGKDFEDVQDLQSTKYYEGKLRTTPYRGKFEDIDEQISSGKTITTSVEGNNCYINIANA